MSSICFVCIALDILLLQLIGTKSGAPYPSWPQSTPKLLCFCPPCHLGIGPLVAVRCFRPCLGHGWPLSRGSTPPAQGYASPSRKLVLPQIDHNYTVGVIYVYICIDCQSSILSHMVPELINNLICWNCKGCIGKSIGPVQYRFTIPSLLAQCHVAGSMPRCWLSAS